MSSTQRSESINAFLDLFVNSKTCLRVFVKSFESALARLRRREIDEDFKCINGDPRLISLLQIERQFAKAYTHKIFYKFQNELLGMLNLRCSISDRFGNTRVYMVEDDGMKYMVDFNSENQTFSCQCHLFETDGLICSHANLVYKQEGVESAPPIYILDRWRKECKRHHLNAKAVAVRVKERRETYNNLYSLLHPVFLDLIDYALLDEINQEAVVDGLNGLRISISKGKERMTESVGNNGNNETAESASNIRNVNGDGNEDAVKDPIKRRKRGRHPTKRLKSTAEVVLARARKKKNANNMQT